MYHFYSVVDISHQSIHQTASNHLMYLVTKCIKIKKQNNKNDKRGRRRRRKKGEDTRENVFFKKKR